jgi:X-Pro dipeptidyl-peptidase
VLSTLPAQAATPSQIVVQNGVTQPAFSYADAIREHVWVKTTLDNDGNGIPDMVGVDIIRPKESNDGLKVPVIMDASPYYTSLGRGNESQLKKWDAAGNPSFFPLFYDNYFVPRGYAIVLPDMSGTSKSTGCVDIGGPNDIGTIKAVVDWLNGRAEAYNNVDATGSPIAASWTTGKVGMIGKSYDGTLANGVAATGVDGLKTIVPISAIDSWYNYYRMNGVRTTNTSLPASLANTVRAGWSYNGYKGASCTAINNELTAGNSTSGDYTPFWAARDYTKDASKVKASVFIIHGFNDLNVKPTNFDRWWAALAANNVPRKIWVHQYAHTDPFDIDRAYWVQTLHRWFDYWLQDVQNGIMNEPMARIQTGVDSNGALWENQVTWPIPQARDYPLTMTKGATNNVGTLTVGQSSGTISFTGTSQTEANMIANPDNASTSRAAFLSPVLDKPVRISGNPKISLNVSSNQPNGNLTFMLVDYGSESRVNWSNSGGGITTGTTRDCWGESTTADSACYLKTPTSTTTSSSFILARGWMNIQHRDSLDTSTPMPVDTPTQITWAAMPQDYTVQPGHRIGVIIGGNDSSYVTNITPTPTFTIDLAKSSVSIPMVGFPVSAWVPDGTGFQTITADLQPGTLALSVSSSLVTLPNVTLNGYDQFVDGALNSVIVADGRGSAAGWSLTGQVSDFVGPNGLILADNLGWGPTASVVAGTLPTIPSQTSAVAAGAATTPGTGTGLANARTLCSSIYGVSAGAFSCGGSLKLGVPGTTMAGTYTGVLTLTLV